MLTSDAFVFVASTFPGTLLSFCWTKMKIPPAEMFPRTLLLEPDIVKNAVEAFQYVRDNLDLGLWGFAQFLIVGLRG